MIILQYPNPKEEEEIIQRMAKFVVDRDLSVIALPLLEAYSITDIPGYLGFVSFYPFAAALGKTWTDMAYMMGTHPSKTGKRLMERIEELEEEKKRLKEATKSKTKQGWKARIRSAFKKLSFKKNKN